LRNSAANTSFFGSGFGGLAFDTSWSPTGSISDVPTYNNASLQEKMGSKPSMGAGLSEYPLQENTGDSIFLYRTGSQYRRGFAALYYSNTGLFFSSKKKKR